MITRDASLHFKAFSLRSPRAAAALGTMGHVPGRKKEERVSHFYQVMDHCLSPLSFPEITTPGASAQCRWPSRVMQLAVLVRGAGGGEQRTGLALVAWGAFAWAGHVATLSDIRVPSARRRKLS